MPKGSDRKPSPRKDRSDKVNQFKNQQKLKNKRMSEKKSIEIPQSPVAEQYPVWNSKEIIEVSGLEWEAIYGFLNMFSNAVMAGQAVLNRNMQSGKIKWVYKDAEGNDVAQEEVEKYQAKIQEYFQSQTEKAKAAPVEDSQQGVPFIDALVDENGKELKS